jgi:hypothetical protein
MAAKYKSLDDGSGLYVYSLDGFSNEDSPCN